MALVDLADSLAGRDFVKAVCCKIRRSLVDQDLEFNRGSSLCESFSVAGLMADCRQQAVSPTVSISYCL